MTPNEEIIDLSRYDEEYEAVIPEERGFDEVSDGKYQTRVEKVELTHSKTSGHPMLKWTFKILGPAFEGRLLFKNSVFSGGDSLKYFKSDLATCGIVLPKMSMLPQYLSKLLDLRVEVSKSTKGENSFIYINKLIQPGDAVTPVATSKSKPTTTSYTKASKDASKPF